MMGLSGTHACKLRPVLCVVLVGLLVGCTPTFAYRHADWLVLWKVDHYFDLTTDQKAFLRGRLHDLLARHRQEALPRYVAVLRQLKDKVQDGLTRDEVDWAFATYQDLRADLVGRLVEDGAVFLASVEEPQIRYFEQTLRQDEEQVTHLLQGDGKAPIAQRAAATLAWLNDWLGPLTTEQEDRIAHLSRTLPDTQEAWLEYHTQRQQEVVHLLRSTRNSPILAQHLRAWLLYPEHNAPLGYQRAVERMGTAVKEMAVAIDQMMTPRQRAHVLVKLQDLIDDLQALTIS